jgi:NAD+ synthase
LLQPMNLDCDREIARIVTFIRAQLAQANHTRLVLGLSGGIDSALVGALSIQAAGAQNLKGLILPYRTSNPDSEAHARLLVDAWGIPWERFEITDLITPFLSRYADISDGRKGNLMARARMMILFDQSAAFKGLVAGTSNRTETLLGYFTMHGDGAAAFKPIGHLYKCQVRALARHLGLPQPILDKAPSADLWAGQTDEGELGYSYDEADQILYLLTEEHLDCAQAAERGFDLRVVQAVERRMRTTAFKRLPAPVLPTVAEERAR